MSVTLTGSSVTSGSIIIEFVYITGSSITSGSIDFLDDQITGINGSSSSSGYIFSDILTLHGSGVTSGYIYNQTIQLSGSSVSSGLVDTVNLPNFAYPDLAKERFFLYDENFQPLDLELTEVEFFSWTRRWNGPDNFEIHLNRFASNAESCILGRWIVVKNSDYIRAGIIEHRQIQMAKTKAEETWTIRGRDAGAYLARRLHRARVNVREILESVAIGSNEVYMRYPINIIPGNIGRPFEVGQTVILGNREAVVDKVEYIGTWKPTIFKIYYAVRKYTFDRDVGPITVNKNNQFTATESTPPVYAYSSGVDVLPAQAAETMMRYLMRYNIGSQANLVGPNRRLDYIDEGERLPIGDRGRIVSRSLRYANALETIQEIAAGSDLGWSFVPDLINNKLLFTVSATRDKTDVLLKPNELSGISYRESIPSTDSVLVAGSGQGEARLIVGVER